ncbi:PhoPQ-activated pathogenicity-related family protein [Pseudozobellia thermophila]|uniref:PhoPQ-activated pathogenicity-related protein n=1 Tax=Pseudozobellia thermophila TaxID=192903 RepID=A0A1M6I558_9FLAO|nr:PhoPQ-activated protein PqaA family protein [Pseudozobellia thermophila]SHJ29616.1 PhoPQ-activated pathogenicity-related protein [Pseudozobellia thermophila]
MKTTLTLNKLLLCLVVVGASLFSCKQAKKDTMGLKSENVPEVTPETALENYLDTEDGAYEWTVKDSFDLDGTMAYDLLLTSQKWREHTWKHQLTILVPDNVSYDGALLFITGGSVKDGEPKWKSLDKDDKVAPMALMAAKNKAIAAIIRQVPMQPLYEGDLVEDQLISFTLHNFKKDKDYTWPLLFPMVKSAVRAMDAVQEFSKGIDKEVNRFTVTGASKRGWTTWLTGASDQRVEAIAPMVIDVLNMPVSLDYHIEAWNEYSVQINDYIKLEIPQTVNSEDGQALTQMIDPYSYRADLTMPKIIFIGTNDEYWPVDAIKNYIDDIPGENYIHYTPNAGHNLDGGERALKALSGFWGQTLAKKPYDDLTYNLQFDDSTATLSVGSKTDNLVSAFLWSTNSTDRDFRDEEWKSIPLKPSDDGTVTQKIRFPDAGYKAFYIDMEYKDANGGTYTKSTRMYLADDDEVL